MILDAADEVDRYCIRLYARTRRTAWTWRCTTRYLSARLERPA
ncbi:hypothetical protein [Cellulomonas humilata]|nr:hypothetical protein [Cellulomonas humilata]